MAPVSIYARGIIKDHETSQKKVRILPPRPALLTSFSHRSGSVFLGVVLIAFGIFCGWVLLTQHPDFFEKLVLGFGTLTAVVGLWILGKAVSAFGKAAQPHGFFFYDANRVVYGTTKPLEQTEVRRILGTPKLERIGLLTAIAPGYVEIPIKAIEYAGLTVEKVQLHIDKLTIKGAGAVITVDFTALLPSINLSGITGDAAFNSISQFYTGATGKTILASIENP
jgi:hypothetical protein